MLLERMFNLYMAYSQSVRACSISTELQLILLKQSLSQLSLIFDGITSNIKFCISHSKEIIAKFDFASTRDESLSDNNNNDVSYDT